MPLTTVSSGLVDVLREEIVDRREKREENEGKAEQIDRYVWALSSIVVDNRGFSLRL